MGGFQLDGAANAWLSARGAGFGVGSQGQKRLEQPLLTDHTIAQANTAVLRNTKGTLDGSGTAQAAFHIPKIKLPSAIGLVFHHAYLVYDQRNNLYMASNAVPLKLVR